MLRQLESGSYGTTRGAYTSSRRSGRRRPSERDPLGWSLSTAILLSLSIARHARSESLSRPSDQGASPLSSSWRRWTAARGSSRSPRFRSLSRTGSSSLSLSCELPYFGHSVVMAAPSLAQVLRAFFSCSRAVWFASDPSLRLRLSPTFYLDPLTRSFHN
jgi:hypothetical protein